MEGTTVTVLKTDKIINIPEDDLRNGDILLFQAGDLVPADLRLVEARGLEVDESDLTGDFVWVEKKAGEEEVFIYRGSKVTRGNGVGVVVATGEETEYGRILKQSQALRRCKPPILVVHTAW